MKTPSQRATESQARRKAAGFCIKCGEPKCKESRNFCLTHREIDRKSSLARARKKLGIPEDRGLYERGPKNYES